jgi:hypothetical protein
MLRGLGLATAAASVPRDYLLTPGGYTHRSCVHRISSSSFFSADSLVPCDFPMIPFRQEQGKKSSTSSSSSSSSTIKNVTHGSAWKTWAQSAPGGSVTSLSSEWTVPGEPGNSAGQTLFFWNGIEPEDTSAVLQPVLQWGSSAAGGGNYWAYSSWYVSANHGSHFSELISVQEGDVVTGGNTLDAKSGIWNITCSAPGRKPSTLSFKPVPGAWPTAYHVLEAYGVTNTCNLYPAVGSVNFTNVQVSFDSKPVAPIQWTFETQTANCGEHTTATNQGDEVTIHFNTN